MKLSPLPQLTILLFLTATFASAQPPTETELRLRKEKQTAFVKSQIDYFSRDAAKLKLPENLAIAYARLGKIYWEIDETRARQFFQSSIDNLIIVQKEALEADNQRLRNDMLTTGQTREMILRIIVACDEDLGFEMFEKSRSEVIKDAFLDIPPPRTFFNPINDLSANAFLVQSEIALEETLASLVIARNPQRLINILRRNRPNGLTSGTYFVLKSLQQWDKPTADAILFEIVERISATDFNQDSSGVKFLTYLLTDAANSSLSTLPEIKLEKLRKLAEKLAVFALEDTAKKRQITYDWYLASTLIKLLPERAAVIEANMQKKPQRIAIPVETPAGEKKVSEFYRQETDLEILLREADKFPPIWRERIYGKAIRILAVADNQSRAKEIIAQKFPLKQQAGLLNDLYLNLGLSAAAKRDYRKALAYIGQSDAKNRFGVLLNLINSTPKIPIDTENALTLLDAARKTLPAKPTTKTDFQRFGQLASSYALVKPQEAFRLLETLLKKYAEINESTITANEFNESYLLRNREFVIIGFNQGFTDMIIPLKNFIKTDPAKTLKLINGIKRADLRLPLELELAETALAP